MAPERLQTRSRRAPRMTDAAAPPMRGRVSATRLMKGAAWWPLQRGIRGAWSGRLQRLVDRVDGEHAPDSPHAVGRDQGAEAPQRLPRELLLEDGFERL